MWEGTTKTILLSNASCQGILNIIKLNVTKKVTAINLAECQLQVSEVLCLINVCDRRHELEVIHVDSRRRRCSIFVRKQKRRIRRNCWRQVDTQHCDAANTREWVGCVCWMRFTCQLHRHPEGYHWATATVTSLWQPSIAPLGSGQRWV